MRLPGPVLAALTAQLRTRRSVLDGGARHLGWKVARSIPGVEEYLGPGRSVFGYLTSGTTLGPDGICDLADAAEPCAETELTVYLGRDVAPDGGLAAGSAAIDGLGVAVEIVDVGFPAGMHAAIAQNVYHRAVVFGPMHGAGVLDADGQAWMEVNGELRETASSTTQLAETVVMMARLLDVVGERLRAGDRIICGSLTHGPVSRGDHLTAGIAGLGSVSVTLA